MEDLVPRQPRPIDPDAGPVPAFATQLRQLRDQAGNPKYLQMARTSGRSRTALAEAAGGDHLPTWETVAAFVTACKGDVPAWRGKWEQVRDQVRENGSQIEEDSLEPKPGAVDPVAAPSGSGNSSRYRPLPYIATGLATAIVAVGTTTLILANTNHNTHGQPLVAATPAQTATVITVQNKIALGADRLIEDTTPAYLSTKTAPFCARDGCKVPGTEMASGVMLVSICHVDGTEMFNYNLDSSESKQNPHRAGSLLWYRTVLHDGRTGYISEVYVLPEDRGGKGLPICN